MRICILFGTLICFTLAVGCKPNTPDKLPTNSDEESGEHDHDHDHGHDHGHSHGHSHEAAGPHGGHSVELGEEAYHLEWTHDDQSGLITVYVLDGEMQQEVPIEADRLTMEVTIVDQTREYELAAADQEEGRSARFQATNKSLIEALKMAGQGAEVSLEVPVRGETYRVEFAHESH